jgi:transcriptional regulator with PAS, ATPase and Fis domain
VRYLIYRASQTRSTVLLTGESGTGKTLIAREIHNLTFSEEDQPFISVNCSAIPIHLFESELFGYIKGAFTGAERTGKKGLFELAENGTLFLDEIGELPPEMQVKLLHALQSKAFYKVGATTPTQVNVRIIAATNKNLLSEIKQKNFREDLYYRINGFPIEIPPLRRRKSDLYPLIDNFLEQLPTHIGGRPKALTGDALEQILRYDWPGNIRELENILELAYNMAEGDYIGEDDLLIPEGSTDMMTLKGYLENQEKAYIEQQLEASKFSVQETLKALGLSKTAFYEKVKKYGILLRPDEF